MNRKLHIKKGDMVYVNAGNDKGKTGKVLEIITKKDRAMEAGIHISNLQVVDPAKGGPTRIGRRMGENGKLVRYAKKSGEEIK